MSEQIDTNELRKLEPVAWLIDSYHLSNLSLLFSDKQAAGNYANDFDTHQFDEPHETREAYEVDPVAIADELDALRAKVAKLTAERDALRELLDELSTTGAKSVAMVGTSGPGVTITTGLAFRTLEESHAFGHAMVKLGEYYQAKGTDDASSTI